MANVKTQGTQAFTVIDGQVFRFVCMKKIGFGQDSFGKIDVTCLEAESKKYLRGMRDPGEGSFDIDYDDENASHDKLAELAEKGVELDWYIGSSHSKTPPTYNATTNEIDLPDDRMWLSFKGYVNDAAPNDIEVDAALGYSYTLVRTSKVTKTKRTVTP
ncbi:phage tail tube protein [Acinetobacter nosocomialis]|uniref:phage tail tube protein n=1 Tax=Acinetobacter nosocomialis TaxID=106654 RepID=UPI001B821409|nr:phage tail tube protein [Acinetobacter nosocomialis]MBR7715533.1 structural protein 3 family protein [Acinetobacter nosocomialis]